MKRPARDGCEAPLRHQSNVRLEVGRWPSSDHMVRCAQVSKWGREPRVVSPRWSTARCIRSQSPRRHVGASVLLHQSTLDKNQGRWPSVSASCGLHRYGNGP